MTQLFYGILLATFFMVGVGYAEDLVVGNGIGIARVVDGQYCGKTDYEQAERNAWGKADLEATNACKQNHTGYPVMDSVTNRTFTCRAHHSPFVDDPYHTAEVSISARYRCEWY